MKTIKIVNHFFITCLVLLAACSSWNEIERTPAEASSLIDEVFTIHSEGKTSSQSSKEIVENHLNSIHQYDKYKLQYKFIKSSELSTTSPFKVAIELDDKTGKFSLNIFHAPKAFNDADANQSLINFVGKIIDSNEFNHSLGVYEAYYNAREGDPVALLRFQKFKEPITETATHKKITETLKQEIKELKKWQKEQKEKRKASLAALDKASDDKQFRTLIAKGDRKGAAKLLRTYLPWEEMPPFEKKYWETYLEVISAPVPLSERVLIYRGIQDDFVHSGIKKGVQLSQKEAILQDNAFVMSTAMVKNQGSWNRRLRTLEAMYDKEISRSYGDDEFKRASRITAMFSNHAGDPNGSPFLSFTPRFEIASSFGYERVSAYLIDPRLLHFNYASTFSGEVEFLVNLTTFPEDLVGICDKKLHDLDNYKDELRKEFLHKKLVAKLEKEYGEKAPDVLIKIQKNSYSFFREKSNSPLSKIEGNDPSSSNKKFYQSLGKDTMKPALGPKGELQCKELIQLFW